MICRLLTFFKLSYLILPYSIFNFRKKRTDAGVTGNGTTSHTLLGDSNTELMGLYKPRTQETRQTYEAVLAYIQDAIGDQVIST